MKAGVAVLALLSGLFAHAAWAGTIYKCVDKSGKVSYQQEECARADKTDKTIDAQSGPADAVPPPGLAKGKTDADSGSAFKKSPKSPTITFYYRPAFEPMGVTISQVEASIRRAASLWGSKCNVNLEYGGVRRGEVALQEQNAKQGYTIRWNGSLAKVSNNGLGAAGRGGANFGVEMNPDSVRNGRGLDRVITHEIGHVIGIGHLHDDPNSIMSYRNMSSDKPNASDYYSCNTAIQQRYGIEFETSEKVTVSKTTDAEVARELLGKDRPRR